MPVTTINGREIRNAGEASYNINLNLGEDMTWTVKRGAEILTYEVYGRFERERLLCAIRNDMVLIPRFTQ